MNPSIDYQTKCALLSDMIVVPTFYKRSSKGCTAIYHLNENKWTKLKNDERKWPLGGEIIRYSNIIQQIWPTIANDWYVINAKTRLSLFAPYFFSISNATKVWYLGGFDQNKKSKAIYEMTLNEMNWKQLNLELPIPIANDTLVKLDAIPREECKPPSLSLGKTQNAELFHIQINNFLFLS